MLTWLGMCRLDTVATAVTALVTYAVCRWVPALR